MIHRFDQFSTFEKFSDLKEVKGATLFTDIVRSSQLWSISETKMFTALDEHYQRMRKIIDQYGGELVKTIGDAFMVHFKTLLEAIQTAIDIQENLQQEPIQVKDQELRIRIGMAFGRVYLKKMTIQGHLLNDYFGSSINEASRMESVVSAPEGFAFAYRGRISNSEEIEELLQERCKVQIIDYQENCQAETKRSGRLLTDQQRYACKPLQQLKGIEEITVYKCSLS